MRQATRDGNRCRNGVAAAAVTLLRPAALERYIARSAQSTSASRSSAGPSSATPTRDGHGDPLPFVGHEHRFESPGAVAPKQAGRHPAPCSSTRPRTPLPPARRVVGGAHEVQRQLAEGRQHAIAAGMAPGVVDALEVVDVEQRERQLMAAICGSATSPRMAAAKARRFIRPVGIRGRHPLRLLDQRGHLERPTELARHDLAERAPSESWSARAEMAN